MLTILSEINCLEKLNTLGVYPDEFYTDIEIFKNNTASFRDATVLVIFAGNCAFNKKHTIELVKNLMKRASSESDFGVKAVYVVSDTVIPSLTSYYKYTGNLDVVDIMRGWNSVKSGVNIWSKLSSRKKDSKLFLSSYDECNSEAAREAYKNRHRAEDDYIRLIQIPNVKEMLSLS